MRPQALFGVHLPFEPGQEPIAGALGDGVGIVLDVNGEAS